MPCYDSRNDPSNVRQETLESARHNSDVAELLCSVCKTMESKGEYMSDKLKVWWEEHKERDRVKARTDREARAVRIQRARDVSASALAELNKLLKRTKDK